MFFNSYNVHFDPSRSPFDLFIGIFTDVSPYEKKTIYCTFLFQLPVEIWRCRTSQTVPHPTARRFLGLSLDLVSSPPKTWSRSPQNCGILTQTQYRWPRPHDYLLLNVITSIYRNDILLLFKCI